MQRRTKLTRLTALLAAVILLAGCSNFPGQTGGFGSGQTAPGKNTPAGRTDSGSPESPEASIKSPEETPEETGGPATATGTPTPLPATPHPKEPEYVAWMRQDAVHELRIEMNPDDWTAIQNDPYIGTYYPADVMMDGIPVSHVGIRTRGHTSLHMAINAGQNRFPLKIKFDKYEKGQTFLGLDELALNNGGDDRSLMRDWLGYEAMRLLDGYSSCVSFFHVFLNGELRGFYIGVEAIDSSYLERYFGSHKHNLYEGENFATLLPDMDLSCLNQKKGADLSKKDVKRLIDVLAQTPDGEKGEIEACIDVDSVLKMMAVNAVLDNRDGFCGFYAHNYYFYQAGGKLVMLPWDMNAPYVNARTDIADPCIDANGDKTGEIRPLARHLLAVDEYYAAYLAYCRQLSGNLPALRERILQIHEIIRPYVEQDPGKFCTDLQFESEFSVSSGSGLVAFLETRHLYLEERLAELTGQS